MFVGPEHPMFGIGRGIASPNRGIWGGDGYLPPMGAPPGARFDPVGPVFPGRGNLGPFGNGRRRPENPDNDEFMPPGMVSPSLAILTYLMRINGTGRYVYVKLIKIFVLYAHFLPTSSLLILHFQYILYIFSDIEGHVTAKLVRIQKGYFVRN